MSWHEETGWSVELRSGIRDHRVGHRFLHVALGPDPAAVAAFVAGLAAGHDLGMSNPAIFRYRGRDGAHSSLMPPLARFAELV